MSQEIYPGQGPEEQPQHGPLSDIPTPDLQAGPNDFIQNGPDLAQFRETPAHVMHEAAQQMHEELGQRLLTNPCPTREEMEIGVYVEEIQPQVRDAVLQMWDKGYDVGNVIHAGFSVDRQEEQKVDLVTPLSVEEVALLEQNGFVVEDNQLSFQPEDTADLDSIKQTWDFLASILPDRGEPVGPAMFGNAVAFREAAEAGTLLDFYMPNGVLDMVGTKYVRERDPLAAIEDSFSPDAASAVRERTFIEQFRALGDRVANNPVPTDEEWNMGAYKEEIEPQVRDAAMLMRRKGYNTGSSGFWGHDHVDQVMDIRTPIDDNSKIRLAALNVEVTDTDVRFTPDNPSDLESVKKTWDLIADILPDLGQHAEPASSLRASVYRQAMRTGRYADYMETWVWQTGALGGQMEPLTMTMLYEGYSFGEDVYAPARNAEAKFLELERLAREA
jgi:hypothetical protein